MENKMVLEVDGINKSFSGVRVLEGARLEIREGELHALMGENGAGKSTLMKIIMGIYARDAGALRLNGEDVVFKNSKEALDAGISMIHQELSPIPEMTVAENVFLGRETKKFKGLPFVDRKGLQRKTLEILKTYGLEDFIDPQMKMKHLNIAQTQMLEIIKAVSYDSKVIIMDEPTSSLSESESEILFRMIHNLKKDKVAIVYISHRMEEVFELADRISVLRDGSFVGCVEKGATSADEIIHMMVGRELEGGYPRNQAKKGDVVLALKNFTSKGKFAGVNLEVRKGEILGLAGLVGAGRSEVMRALVGYDSLDTGEIILEGKSILIQHPKEAKRHHIIMASEDRKGLGLVLCRSIKENISLQNMDKLSKMGFLNRANEQVECKRMATEMETKMNGIHDVIQSLSGGNQQKVVLAKCLLSDPKVLILDEPTRGIDVGTKAAIYQMMIQLAQQGLAIIMISSEMPELIGMSDRVLVMANGKITGELTREEAQHQEKIMELALGGKTL
jgi:ABC-type sugar transport system, ATPase component